jgi:tetratricopeptide (TPR) repeat protein
MADPGPPDDELIALASLADRPELLVWTLVIVADLAVSRGDVRAATEWFGAARAVSASRNDARGDSIVAFIDANQALLDGDNAASERHWARLAALGRETGSITFEAGADVALSNFAESRGDYQRATELLETSRRLEAEMGFHGRDVTSVVRLANLAGLMGDWERASALFDDADRVAADDALRPVVARALTGLALRHRQAHRLDLAEDAAQRALTLYRAIGFEPGMISSLCSLGFIDEVRGQARQAEKRHREALLVAANYADPKRLALCLEGLAGIALLEQDTRKSAALLGAAFGLREGKAIPQNVLAGLSGMLLAINTGMLDDRFDAERIEAEGRKVLGDQEFEAAAATGVDVDIEALTRSS